MFLGPSSYSISAMGDKIESKRIASAAKVNMIPGFDGEIEDVEHAVKVSNDIGETFVLILWCIMKNYWMSSLFLLMQRKLVLSGFIFVQGLKFDVSSCSLARTAHAN